MYFHSLLRGPVKCIFLILIEGRQNHAFELKIDGATNLARPHVDEWCCILSINLA